MEKEESRASEGPKALLREQGFATSTYNTTEERKRQQHYDPDEILWGFVWSLCCANRFEMTTITTTDTIISATTQKVIALFFL